MKDVTFGADDELIEAARERARSEKTTLDELLRAWLAEYARRRRPGDEAMDIIDRISSYATTGGRKFSRDEMNER